MINVTVIDYGMGNLFSVQQALEHCGARVEITDKPKRVDVAERLVLPGVGAFADGMAALKERGLIEAIQQFSERQRPFLGICLGMQMMFESSEEFGSHQGLSLIRGKVVMIPEKMADGKARKIPHIGWSPLDFPANGRTWSGTLLDSIEKNDSFYFVHSYMASPSDEQARLADCHYDGIDLCAVVAKGAISGCQFHPEKSGPAGLKVIRSFLAQC